MALRWLEALYLLAVYWCLTSTYIVFHSAVLGFSEEVSIKVLSLINYEKWKIRILYLTKVYLNVRPQNKIVSHIQSLNKLPI